MQPRSPKKRPTKSLVRPIVQQLHAYVPGEQPKIKGLIKLNTNENPYGPAPKVLAAIKSAVDGRLRLYPNPTAERLRAKLAELHGCAPENIIVGNGSDELLALATRAFVEPLPSEPTETPSASTVQFFHPSYSLYPVLAAIHGARSKPVPLGKDFTLPSMAELRERNWDFEAALTYVTTPNAPSGCGFSRADLETLCQAHRGVLVLDEAYVDFAAEHALELALRYPHVLIARTFSKAYSLCFLRVGYLVGNVELVAALDKVRDSYNVNGLGQVAAETTLDALPYYRKNFRRIIASREHTAAELTKLGFEVLPSQTNFILIRPPADPAAVWLQRLREHKILVRWFSHPEIRDFLRITIGTESEMAQLLKVVRTLVKGTGRAPGRVGK